MLIALGGETYVVICVVHVIPSKDFDDDNWKKKS